ncbi:MAG: inorganic diphosphatase [Bacteroidota bacterium]
MPARDADGNINIVVEIPAGTQAKWEVEKESGDLVWERKNGDYRVVQYLGYPGNYGMVPQTLLDKAEGGDGDPLDVILLGAAVERGSVVPAKLVGVLRLLDGGEQDDKLIAVPAEGPFSEAEELEEVKAKYGGALEIVELWFSNYKGPGEMESKGFGDRAAAEAILKVAHIAYQAAENK